jgi:hydroxymethylbilane synthase
MPTTLPPGLTIGAILKRDSPLDALCIKFPQTSTSYTSAHALLSSLPPNALIGTSSLRRTAQLRRKYPQLLFDICRGNLPTRLAKLDNPKSFDNCPEFTALILAAAGLRRIGLENRITTYLDGSVEGGSCLYAVGQGAIGVEIRANDERVRGLIDPVNDRDTRWACMAERSLMRALEGGCSVPIGVESTWSEGGLLKLKGIVVSIDGSEAVDTEGAAVISSDEQAEELGKKIAKALVEKGANKILDVIIEERKKQQEETLARIGDPKAYIEQQQAGLQA